jgi:hypothetical protein
MAAREARHGAQVAGDNDVLSEIWPASPTGAERTDCDFPEGTLLAIRLAGAPRHDDNRRSAVPGGEPWD